PRMPQRRGFVAAATTLLVFPVIPRLAHASQVVAVRTWPADEYTRVTLELGAELKTEHFTLDDPDRLVVDLHGVKLNDTLKQLNGMVQANDPYIKEVRVGQNTPDVVRLVLDLKQPIAPQVFTLKPVGDYKYRFVIDLYPLVAQDPILALQQQFDDDDPLAAVLEELAMNESPSTSVPKVEGQKAPPTSKSPSTAKKSPPPPVKSAPSQRPILIAIDPGHGGEDPGATGPNGTREKDVVLQIARRLQKHIDAQPTARGSSVYALSQNGASSTAARWLANKENEADMVGGLNVKSHDKQVAQVLLDLSTAAQINDLLKVGSQILGNIGQINRLHKSQ